VGRGRGSSSGEKRGRIGWGTRTEGVRERWKDFDALRDTFTEVVEGFTEPIAGAVDPVVKLIVGHKRQSMTYEHFQNKFEGSIQKASPLSRPQNRTFGSHFYQCHDFWMGRLKAGKSLLEARLFRWLQRSGEDSAIVSLRSPAYRLSRVSPSIQRQAGPVGTASAAMGFFRGVAQQGNRTL